MDEYNNYILENHNIKNICLNYLQMLEWTWYYYNGKNINNKLVEISESTEIGKIVMAELLKLDHVAYLRFASVYLNFDDMESFRNVIKVLEKDLSPEMKKKQINLLDDEDG